MIRKASRGTKKASSKKAPVTATKPDPLQQIILDVLAERNIPRALHQSGYITALIGGLDDPLCPRILSTVINAVAGRGGIIDFSHSFLGRRDLEAKVAAKLPALNLHPDLCGGGKPPLVKFFAERGRIFIVATFRSSDDNPITPEQFGRWLDKVLGLLRKHWPEE